MYTSYHLSVYLKGIPFAMRETGLITGWILILLSGVLGSKSLRLLVETAKHVDSASYEILCETVFGRAGWILCNAMMFCMSWGPMLSYLMLVKDTLGQLLGYDGKICLVVASMCVMLPLSLQRDMADLAKTSRLSVLFNIGLVTSFFGFLCIPHQEQIWNQQLPSLVSLTEHL